MKHIIVVTSTFPASHGDSVPGFVRDQVIAQKNLNPEYIFTVLAPHDTRSKTLPLVKHELYFEYRFHYAWPRRFEKLAGHGIMPTLKQNKAYYLLVPLYILAEFFTLWRITKKTKPDLLYAHWFMPQGITAGLVSMLTRVPFVFTSHSSDVSILHKLPFGKMVVRFFVKRARAATTVSTRSLHKLKTFFSANLWQNLKHKVSVIPMGTNVSACTASEPGDTHPKNVLFIGRLVEKKGVQYVLQAFQKLSANRPGVNLVIAGDGPWLARLQEQAKHLGLTKVSFVGFVAGAEKKKWITWADIFVVPSIITAAGDAEGLPVSLMEGLAAGKICVATNESGADDIIENDVHGFLVPQKNVVALHGALQAALTLNPLEQKQMRLAALQIAKQFSWPIIAKRHRDFLLVAA